MLTLLSLQPLYRYFGRTIEIVEVIVVYAGIMRC